MASKVLSPKRQAILEYIEEFTLRNGYAPSVREIAEAVGLRSPSTVHSHLKILEEGGYLQKSKGKTRTLSLAGQVSYKNVPVLGTVRAGAPILALQDTVGYVPFETRDDNHFGLSVKGDSMKNAAILEDDVVIVRRQPTADNGDIVVALIDDEATVKRLKIEKGHIWLMPENPDYQPIDGSSCSILGVVVAVYRYHVS